MRGKLGLVLMGGAMFSKSLIQFSVDNFLCSLPVLYLGQNYGGGNEDGPSKGPMRALLHSVPPTLQQPTAEPFPHQRLLDTYGQVWVTSSKRPYAIPRSAAPRSPAPVAVHC